MDRVSLNGQDETKYLVFENTAFPLDARVGETFLKSFQEVFDDQLPGEAAPEKVDYQTSSSRAKPTFSPDRFGLDQNFIPVVGDVLQTLNHLEFKGSLSSLKKTRTTMIAAVNQRIKTIFKENSISTRQETLVEFDLNLNLKVSSFYDDDSVEFLLSQDSNLKIGIRRICIISEFLSCMRGIEDFNQLYRLVPQRAVDMFGEFLKNFARQDFAFRVGNHTIRWYFQNTF